MLTNLSSTLFLSINQQRASGVKYLFLLICLLNSFNISAGGFQINLQGCKNSGMGNTGSGAALDNAAIFFNPGALVFCGPAAINIYGAALIGKVTYTQQPPNFDKYSSITKVGTPFSLFTHFKCKSCGDSSKWALGLGLYTAYGSALQWPQHWQGQYLVNSIKLKSIFLQPTFSWKFSNKFSIGLGVIFANGGFAFNKSLPIDNGSLVPAINLSAKANGLGLSFGSYYIVNKNLSLGIGFKTPIKLNLFNGTASFTSIPSSLVDSFPTTSFTSTINLPATLQLGSAYAVNKKWLVLLDVLFTSWALYDTIQYDFVKNTALLNDSKSIKNYYNTSTFKLGAQYTFSPFKKFRFGVVIDPTPANKNFAGPESPDNTKFSVSTGVSQKLSNSTWMEINSLLSVGKPFYFSNNVTGFKGSFKIKAMIFGIGFYSKFGK
jgi:long-chain fatty acid transport protein